MRTFILSAALITMGLGANAQDAVVQSKFTDNMSLSLKGGAATPLNSSAYSKTDFPSINTLNSNEA